MPDYLGLRIGASILMVSAVLSYIGAVLWLLAGFSNVGFNGTKTGIADTLMTLVLALPFITGGLLHTISAAATAHRDIARNNFK